MAMPFLTDYSEIIALRACLHHHHSKGNYITTRVNVRMMLMYLYKAMENSFKKSAFKRLDRPLLGHFSEMTCVAYKFDSHFMQETIWQKVEVEEVYQG